MVARQFDVVTNPNPATRSYSPYLVVLQSHHLDPLETVFLAPLVSDAGRPVDLLHVEVAVEGRRLLVAVPEAAGVPRARVGKVIGSLVEHEGEIRRAFERLLSGF